MTKDMGNTEVHHVSTSKAYQALLVGLTFKALETIWEVWTQEDLLSKEDQVWKN